MRAQSVRYFDSFWVAIRTVRSAIINDRISDVHQLLTDKYSSEEKESSDLAQTALNGTSDITACKRARVWAVQAQWVERWMVNSLCAHTRGSKNTETKTKLNQNRNVHTHTVARVFTKINYTQLPVQYRFMHAALCAYLALSFITVV